MQGGKVQFSDKKYTTIKHEFCINFSNQAYIVTLEDPDMPMIITYEYASIKEIDQNIPPHSCIDFIGIVHTVGPCTEVHPKHWAPIKWRNISVADDTNQTIIISLWGKHAEAEYEHHPVLSFKGVVVNDYSGKCLNSCESV